MRALKILVVVMGVMILAGVAALGVVIAGRLSRGGAGTTSQPFAASPIELPAGARIETMSTSADRLVIDLVLPDGNRRLVIIDLATGRLLGAIPLRTAP
jgi:hypothetical protein